MRLMITGIINSWCIMNLVLMVPLPLHACDSSLPLAVAYLSLSLLGLLNQISDPSESGVMETWTLQHHP